MPSSFTPRERELIRREFCRHFGQDPSRDCHVGCPYPKRGDWARLVG